MINYNRAAAPSHKVLHVYLPLIRVLLVKEVLIFWHAVLVILHKVVYANHYVLDRLFILDVQALVAYEREVIYHVDYCLVQFEVLL